MMQLCNIYDHRPPSLSRKGPSLSVLDDLRGIEERVVARLKELKQLVEEYEELQRAANRLGVDTNTGDGARPRGGAARAAGTSTQRRRKPARGPAAATHSRRRPGGTRATGAERRQNMLEMIEKRPGITVA